MTGPEPIYVAELTVRTLPGGETLSPDDEGVINFVFFENDLEHLEDEAARIVRSVDLAVFAIGEVLRIEPVDFDSLGPDLRDAVFRVRDSGASALSTLHVYAQGGDGRCEDAAP